MHIELRKYIREVSYYSRSKKEKSKESDGGSAREEETVGVKTEKGMEREN